MSRDPIEEEGGLNLYVFILNNPVVLIDPVGFCAIQCCNNCQTRYNIEKQPTGKRKSEKHLYWDIITQMRAKQIASAIARYKSPAKLPLPTIEVTVQIGEIVYLEEWMEYTCLVEICLDDMRVPLELGCKKNRGTEYWIVLNTKEINKTYEF